MRKRTIGVVVAIAIAATRISAFTFDHAERPASGRPNNLTRSTTSSPAADAIVVPGLSTAIAERDIAALEAYFDDITKANVVAYVSAVHDAEVAAAASRPVQTISRPANNGAHSDAWWRGVSVCEQGGRNDSYFGYFSIMDGSAGGLDWSTQVAMANAIIARAGDGAWAASCQAAGYAASPGG